MAIIFSVITLILAWVNRDLTRVEPRLGLAILGYTVFYAVLSLLTHRLPNGLDIGLQNIAVMAIFLSSGALPAIATAFIGATLAEIWRVAFSSEFIPLHKLRPLASTILFDAGISTYSTLCGGFLYVWLGGQIPLTLADLRQVLPIVVGLSVAFIFYQLPQYFGSAARFAPLTNSRQWIKTMLYILLAEIFPMTLAILLAASYHYGYPMVVFIFLGGTVMVAALLARRSAQAQETLEWRLRELTALNNVGQALASGLTLPNPLQHLYEQVRTLIDAENFTIAECWSDVPNPTYSFVVRNGELVSNFYGTPLAVPIAWLNEQVIRIRQPILRSGPIPSLSPEPPGTLQREDNRKDSGAEMMCYLGVPLIAEDIVIGVMAIHSPRADAFGQSELMILSAIGAQAAIMLRNISLYKRMAGMSNKLSLLNNVSSLLTASLDLDSVLKTIASVILEVAEADKAAIFLAEADESSLHLAYSIGLSEDFVAQFQGVSHNDTSGPMQVLHRTSGMAIPDVRSDVRALGWRALADLEGYSGLLTVPLIANDTVIGFLAAFYNQPHVFGKSEQDLMMTLANQVAVTVANARLYKDTQDRAADMASLANASRAFTASLELNKVAARVIIELDAVLKPDAVALMLNGANGEPLKSLAQQGQAFPDVIIPTGALLQATDLGKTVEFPQSREDIGLLRQLNLKSLLAIPLVNQGKAIGIALIGYCAIRLFTFRERQLAEAIVNQAATAIRNAQLFKQVDTALDDRVRELSAIEAISRKISASLDLDAVIAQVLDAALEVTHASIASCALIIPSDPDLMAVTEKYEAGAVMMPISNVIPATGGVVGQVISTGRIAWIGDVRDHPEYRPASIPGMRSELCIPIVTEGRVVGVINVESDRPDAFMVFHKRFMVMLADHTALALGNVRLFEERQIQIENLYSMHELSLKLLSAVSLKGVMKLTVQYTQIITHSKDVHLYLYDRQTDTLTFGASMWLDGREDVEATPPSRDGRTLQTARTGRADLITNMSKIDSPADNEDNLSYGAIARVALKRADQVFGVLVIAYREPHQFNESETRTLDLVANQTATAIANARLFEEVRTARDQMQVILDSARDGMLLIGPHSELLLVNPAAERLLNRSLQPFIGQKVLRLLVRARRNENDTSSLDFLTSGVLAILNDIKLAPLEPTRRSFQVHSSNGVRDLEEISLPVCDANGKIAGRLLIMRDVSEEKSMERFREEVTNMLVHDLRNPLGIVISSLRLIQDMIRQEQYLDLPQISDIALMSSENQLRMIESLLEIAKADTLQLVPQSLNDLIHNALMPMEVIAKEAEVRLIDHVPANFPALMIDESKITRVLVNLLDNALRHTPSGGQVRIDATLFNAKGGLSFAKISIIDTGKGIPEELWEHIFDKFFQVPKSALRGYRGAGLGLTFCKRAVEAHGGKIWVGRGPEGGAAFWLTLPLAA